MSVLLELAIFPLDKEESKSAYVARVVEMIRASGFNYVLTPMATVVETSTTREALDLVEKANELLSDCNRIYCVAKLDVRKNRTNGLEQKLRSVTQKLSR
ncbi:MAG: MTH1187 family thiamine-binding protein [Helicobacteraceae bacterium]